MRNTSPQPGPSGRSVSRRRRVVTRRPQRSASRPRRRGSRVRIQVRRSVTAGPSRSRARRPAASRRRSAVRRPTVPQVVGNTQRSTAKRVHTRRSRYVLSLNSNALF